MAADKASSNQTAKSDVSRDKQAISEDITRVVGYLNTKRSNANQLTSGLAQEISHRRDDVSEHKRLHGRESSPSDQARISEPKARNQSNHQSNPALAERYHAFCHDLDLMLDGFRARVDGDKPIKH